MKKRTVIISKINDDYTAFVKNMGIEELSLFKKLEDNGVELKDEGNISDEEMLVLLRHCCIDGFIECVYSIENHFNRDQKQINIIKTNIENKQKSKGLTIVTHTDWKPSFGGDIRGLINKRNYLTILCENIKRKNLEYDKLAEEFENFKKEIEAEKNRLEAELENYNKEKRNKLDKEIKETERIIELNKDKIRKQNWFLDQHPLLEKDYNELKEKFDKLIERYKNGEKICETQLIEAQKKWPQELKNIETEINSKKNELANIEEELKTKKHELSENQKSLDYTKNLICRYETDLDHILQKYLL